MFFRDPDLFRIATVELEGTREVVLFEVRNRPKLPRVSVSCDGRLGRSLETGRRRVGFFGGIESGSVFCPSNVDDPFVLGSTNLLRGAAVMTFVPQEIRRC
jgi:hypothetical protein